MFWFFCLQGLWDLSFPKGSNLHPLHWKLRVLITVPPGNSLKFPSLTDSNFIHTKKIFYMINLSKFIIWSTLGNVPYALEKNVCFAVVGWCGFYLILINLNYKTNTSFIGRHPCMSGTTWAHESTFSIVNVVKSEYRSSISDENLVPKGHPWQSSG